MQYRSLATLISSGIIALAGLAGAPSLHAQARFAAVSAPLELPPTSLLGALSQYRTIRWATSAHVIHCSPAPLIERPGVQTAYNRPHVVPLEESFADAQSVKRSLSYKARPVAMENR